MVNTSALLVPPLLQPRSPELPLGVCTVTLTAPGAEIKLVVSMTFNCPLLITVVLTVSPLIKTTDEETNWLPFTINVEPCCTSENGIVLGEREPISGAGLELPQSGFRVLLQPEANNSASKRAKHRTGVREGMGDTPPDERIGGSPSKLWSCSWDQHSTVCRGRTPMRAASAVPKGRETCTIADCSVDAG
jgi:hypothetical protein